MKHSDSSSYSGKGRSCLGSYNNCIRNSVAQLLPIHYCRLRWTQCPFPAGDGVYSVCLSLEARSVSCRSCKQSRTNPPTTTVIASRTFTLQTRCGSTSRVQECRMSEGKIFVCMCHQCVQGHTAHHFRITIFLDQSIVRMIYASK